MIVLLPGIQAGPPEFARLLPLLPHGTRVVALPDSLADSLAAIAAEILANLPTEPLDFVGASFGGLVATAMPAARVRSLLTIGTLPFSGEASKRSGRAANLIQYLPTPVYARLYRRRISSSLAEDGADQELLASVRLPNRDVLAARLRAIGRWHFPPPSVPTTFAWGVTDPWVTWEKGQVERRGYEAVLLPGGHRPHLSHPSEVAGWVRSIAEITDSSRR